jgi:glycosyltransferase involved in cell wall biosynthesis
MTEGGILSILNDVLNYANEVLSHRGYEIIALVNDKSKFNYKNITFLEFPKAKSSWLFRIYYEYIYFYFLSKKTKIHLWLAMHDITPHVKAEIVATYCHNASMFYNLKFSDYFWDLKFTLFSKFYKYLYQINIKKNKFVIVQQDWMRKEFIKIFKIDNVFVAYPIIEETSVESNKAKQFQNEPLIFFYPSLPRVHKNHHILFEAAKMVRNSGLDIKIIVTFDGSENRYSKYLHNRYKELSNIDFLGIIKREEVYKYYELCDCLLFPSQLESWGLPLSEFLPYKKPVIVSNLPYASEVLNGFDKTVLFNSDSAEDLAAKIVDFSTQKVKFSIINQKEPSAPFAKNWEELFSKLL